MCLNLFHPDDRGGLQMLPAANFVTVHKMWGTFTSVLLLDLLFFRQSPDKLQHANTNLSNPPDEGRLQSLPDVNECLVYICSTSFAADLACLHRKQNLMLTPVIYTNINKWVK